MLIPRKILGKAMRTIVASMDAINVPKVVFESATHLYSTNVIHRNSKQTINSISARLHAKYKLSDEAFLTSMEQDEESTVKSLRICAYKKKAATSISRKDNIVLFSKTNKIKKTAQELLKIGFGKDIEFACQIDLYSIAPFFHSGAIDRF